MKKVARPELTDRTDGQDPDKRKADERPRLDLVSEPPQLTKGVSAQTVILSAFNSTAAAFMLGFIATPRARPTSAIVLAAPGKSKSKSAPEAPHRDSLPPTKQGFAIIWV